MAAAPTPSLDDALEPFLRIAEAYERCYPEYPDHSGLAYCDGRDLTHGSYRRLVEAHAADAERRAAATLALEDAGNVLKRLQSDPTSVEPETIRTVLARIDGLSKQA